MTIGTVSPGKTDATIRSVEAGDRGGPATILDTQLAAAAAILLMVMIVLVMDWVPTELNRNLRGMSLRERLPSTIIHSTLGLLFAGGNLADIRWLILAGAFWYSVVSVAAVRNWWIPYAFGLHWGEITPEIYRQHYAGNLRVLPRFRNHPVIPDLQHMLIHLSLFTATALSWRSFWLG